MMIQSIDDERGTFGFNLFHLRHFFSNKKDPFRRLFLRCMDFKMMIFLRMEAALYSALHSGNTLYDPTNLLQLSFTSNLQLFYHFIILNEVCFFMKIHSRTDVIRNNLHLLTDLYTLTKAFMIDNGMLVKYA